MLYLGSCRYMYNYDWDFFPGRLHSTREIIFFLEHITNINEVITNNPPEIVNLIFGDIYHRGVINDFNKFMNKKLDKDIPKIIMEISSRKVMYHNNIPLNHFYASRYKQHYPFIEKKLTDEEVEYDLNNIIKLCKIIFNENIEIHIIPHLNLKTRNTLQYIYDRNNFVYLLECLCNKFNIKIHNVGKYIEKQNNDCFIEDYMPDSTHYIDDIDNIRAFIINDIIGK